MSVRATALALPRAALAAGLAFLLLAPFSLAYEDERPERPTPGESVNERVQFFIAADGDPDTAERYRIEIGNEDFDTVLYTFDQLKDPKGWSLGVVGDLEGVSEEEVAWWRGVFFTPPKPLADGEYYWRAFKHDGVEFEELDGEIPFRVDTVPPGPVEGLRAQWKDDGSVEMQWRPVYVDSAGGQEQVAGYRIYRYTTRHYFRVRDTILVGEVVGTRFTDAYAGEDTDAFSFYQVTAVDEAGNEAGRKFPLRLGETP
jgi:hypothetical protein